MLTCLRLVLLLVLLDEQASGNTGHEYEGFKIMEIMPTTDDQVKYLQRIQREDSEVDFWIAPTVRGKAVKLMVSPQHFLRVEQQLGSHQIRNTITNKNVQELVNKESKVTTRRLNRGFDLNDFNTLDNIYKWMDELVKRCPAGFRCEIYSIAQTYQGRPVKVFKIFKNEANRMAYWLDATIHAREWISTTTALNILNRLVTSQDSTAALLRTQYDWYIAPVLNPDGYVYTHTTKRLWRKNVSPNRFSSCLGTDLNRNFDYLWGKQGISFNPCSETYCGSGPASEPEVIGLQKEMLRLAPQLLATVTFHSYGNMWIFPLGEKINGVCTRSQHHADMMDVANAGSNAVGSTYGTYWERGSSCDVIYETSGSSMDYGQAVAGIKYMFCMELRGDDFIVPRTEIQPAFNETWRGIEAMVKRISAKRRRAWQSWQSG